MIYLSPVEQETFYALDRVCHLAAAYRRNAQTRDGEIRAITHSDGRLLWEVGREYPVVTAGAERTGVSASAVIKAIHLIDDIRDEPLDEVLRIAALIDPGSKARRVEDYRQTATWMISRRPTDAAVGVADVAVYTQRPSDVREYLKSRPAYYYSGVKLEIERVVSRGITNELITKRPR